MAKILSGYIFSLLKEKIIHLGSFGGGVGVDTNQKKKKNAVKGFV